MMNRDKVNKLPEMQISFIDTICAPIYSAFAKLFPRELNTLIDGCLNNRNLWTELATQNSAGNNTGPPLAQYLGNKIELQIKEMPESNASTPDKLNSCYRTLEQSESGYSHDRQLQKDENQRKSV